jgi:hypothetical protein
VRLSILRAIRDRLRRDRRSPDGWHDYEFDFTGAVFDDDVDFSYIAIFDGRISFEKATFLSVKVLLTYANFVGGMVSFADAKFDNTIVVLTGGRFSGGHVIFDGSRFVGEGGVYLVSAEISAGEISFVDASFAENTFLSLEATREPTGGRVTVSAELAKNPPGGVRFPGWIGAIGSTKGFKRVYLTRDTRDTRGLRERFKDRFMWR